MSDYEPRFKKNSEIYGFKILRVIKTGPGYRGIQYEILFSCGHTNILKNMSFLTKIAKIAKWHELRPEQRIGRNKACPTSLCRNCTGLKNKNNRKSALAARLKKQAKEQSTKRTFGVLEPSELPEPSKMALIRRTLKKPQHRRK